MRLDLPRYNFCCWHVKYNHNCFFKFFSTFHIGCNVFKYFHILLIHLWKKHFFLLSTRAGACHILSLELHTQPSSGLLQATFQNMDGARTISFPFNLKYFKWMKMFRGVNIILAHSLITIGIRSGGKFWKFYRASPSALKCCCLASLLNVYPCTLAGVSAYCGQKNQDDF